MLTSTSSGGAGGPAVSLTSLLVANELYTITGEIKLTSGESATNANFTMKVTDPTCPGGICFNTLGSSQAVSSAAFAAIGGTFNTNSTETGFLLCAQLVGPSTASFYLDDVCDHRRWSSSGARASVVPNGGCGACADYPRRLATPQTLTRANSTRARPHNHEAGLMIEQMLCPRRDDVVYPSYEPEVGGSGFTR